MEKNSGRDFMEKTKHKNMGVSDQQRHLPQPPLSWAAEPVNQRVELPNPESLAVAPEDIHMLITQRRSLRDYADQPLSLAELSHLLWCTQGVKVIYDQQMTLRTVPSAGARHALETDQVQKLL
ncbi:MAG: nitroreductase family protein [Desulfuromonadaceae bacterium]|nr:nitroreductase family protein [Desulfuromonadaceae bacterium]